MQPCVQSRSSLQSYSLFGSSHLSPVNRAEATSRLFTWTSNSASLRAMLQVRPIQVPVKYGWLWSRIHRKIGRLNICRWNRVCFCDLTRKPWSNVNLNDKGRNQKVIDSVDERLKGLYYYLILFSMADAFCCVYQPFALCLFVFVT